jgi:hypothetical protein
MPPQLRWCLVWLPAGNLFELLLIPGGSVSAQSLRGRVVACYADLDPVDVLLVRF